MVRLRVAASALFLALSFVSPLALADPAQDLEHTLTGDALKDFHDAKLLIDPQSPVKDFAGAAAKFRHAYELSRDARLLWNLAGCEVALSHYAKSIALFKTYGADTSGNVTEADRKDAQGRIESLMPYVGKVTVNVSEPGADVWVAGERVGQSPLAEPVLADLGIRAVKVAKAGFKDYSAPVTVPGNGDVTVAVKLVPDIHEGTLVIHAGPKDTIAVDGEVKGLGEWKGVVKSGGHQVRISAPGMRTYQSEVVVQDDQVRPVDVTLDKEVRAGGIPTWVWIAGGAVVVTGASVGAYFLFKVKEEVGPTTPGTIQPGTVQVPSFRFR